MFHTNHLTIKSTFEFSALKPRLQSLYDYLNMGPDGRVTGSRSPNGAMAKCLYSRRKMVVVRFCELSRWSQSSCRTLSLPQCVPCQEIAFCLSARERFAKRML
ncbi:hypothetical protein CEXT_188361 [Caerostris extrusa]|uniref:Uncharacterized protein n=1 Tax=Caerostris extrusa TaxID=172846 RepID=A0AAV4TB48_CAEEX|nr:hypothetical protein CEXT_188361 [Caerostris extrusa]